MIDPDSPVHDDELLLGWVLQPEHLVPGEFKVMSERFNKVRFSVDREALKPLASFRAEHPNKAVVRFRAGVCRNAGFEVLPDPYPKDDPTNAAHAVVDSSGMTNRQRRRAARSLRDGVADLYRPLEAESEGQ